MPWSRRIGGEAHRRVARESALPSSNEGVWKSKKQQQRGLLVEKSRILPRHTLTSQPGSFSRTGSGELWRGGKIFSLGIWGGGIFQRFATCLVCLFTAPRGCMMHVTLCLVDCGTVFPPQAEAWGFLGPQGRNRVNSMYFSGSLHLESPLLGNPPHVGTHCNGIKELAFHGF